MLNAHTFRSPRVLILAALLAVASAVPAHAGMIFDLQFDNTPDATVTAPIVGTGSISFDDDLLAGDYALNSLTNLAMSFAFGGLNLTLVDLITPSANVLVRIAGSGADLVMTFGGSGGGTFGGSMDFQNASGNLSFQPNFGSLYFSGNSFGTFSAVARTAAVPEPASIALLGLGLAVIGYRTRGKKMAQDPLK